MVASGTSSKQLRREPDALPIGYGSMVLEGFLATLVILACCAGITLTGDSWGAFYSDWNSANGLGPKVGAFVTGSGNFVASMGIPASVGVALMGVLAFCAFGPSSMLSHAYGAPGSPDGDEPVTPSRPALLVTELPF